MPNSPSIQRLPRDVLLNILQFLVTEDATGVKVLATIATVCKSWKDVVYGDDQSIWRELFLREYDSPHDSPLFLHPRTGYDWRQVTIARLAVKSIIYKNEEWAKSLDLSVDLDFYQYNAPVKYGPCTRENAAIANLPSILRHLELMKHSYQQHPISRSSSDEARLARDRQDYQTLVDLITPWRHRFVRFALGLYLDLPRRGTPSKNEPMIEWVRRTTLFRKAILWTQKTDDLNEVDWHFLAVTHLLGVRGPSLALYPKGGIRGWLWPPDGPVPWKAMYPAIARCHDWVADRMEESGLHGRGTGFNVFNTSIINWAGVEGDWLAYSNNYDGLAIGRAGPHVNRHTEPPWRIPRSFNLKLAKQKDEIQRAYGDSNVDIWDHFPEAGLSNPAFPPLYFHGQSTDDSVPAFVYGFVTLSSDTPPEVVWIIGSQTIGQPEQGEIMRVVEHGGLHSRVRAIGAWGSRTYGRRYKLLSTCSPDDLERDACRLPHDDLPAWLEKAMLGDLVPPTQPGQPTTIVKPDSKIADEWKEIVRAEPGDGFVANGPVRLCRKPDSESPFQV